MAEDNEQTYTVLGMSCEHCELSVKEEVEDLAGLEVTAIDHRSGQLTVRGDAIDDASVRAAVAEAGYRVSS